MTEHTTDVSPYEIAALSQEIFGPTFFSTQQTESHAYVARHARVGDASEFTVRQGDELMAFILANLDDEEKEWFAGDLRKAVLESLRGNTLVPIGQTLGDWEATVEVKLDPSLSRELDAAFEESEARRRQQA